VLEQLAVAGVDRLRDRGFVEIEVGSDVRAVEAHDGRVERTVIAMRTRTRASPPVTISGGLEHLQPEVERRRRRGPAGAASVTAIAPATSPATAERLLSCMGPP
jgi:hypothetical protein